MPLPFARSRRIPSLPHRRGSVVSADELIPGAELPNIAGRKVVGPTQGFGQLWRKRYWLVLDPGIAPTDVITAWKRDFSSFWPGTSELRGPIQEQMVTAADIGLPAGTRIATGLVVVRSSGRNFTLMTLQGHIFAGWVRFSSRAADDRTVAEVEVLMRAGDPIYEVGLLLGGHKAEDRFWRETLVAIAEHFDREPRVEMQAVLEDRHRQWSKFFNVWHNAAIRTQLHRAWSWLRSAAGRLRR